MYPSPKRLIKNQNESRFNLTSGRLYVCGSPRYGTTAFFLLKDSAGTSMAAFAMIVVMLPASSSAMYENTSLEIVIKNVIQTEVYPTKGTPYQTENFLCRHRKTTKTGKEVLGYCVCRATMTRAVKIVKRKLTAQKRKKSPP